jgi:hypothetical protein
LVAAISPTTATRFLGMIDEGRARELGKAEFEPDDVVLGEAKELAEGWFFPCIAKASRVFTGVIVNKETGKPLRVMLHSSLERDPTFYDRGYQFEQCDVVVLEVQDTDATVRALQMLGAVTVDVYFKYGRVWRVGRQLTESEIRERLSALPGIFTGRLCWEVEEFDNARTQGKFTCEVLEYRGREDRH